MHGNLVTVPCRSIPRLPASFPRQVRRPIRSYAANGRRFHVEEGSGPSSAEADIHRHLR